jgi:DNA-binding HxlR family transcriptional regulator
MDANRLAPIRIQTFYKGAQMSVATTRSLTNQHAMRAVVAMSHGPMRFSGIGRAVGFENLQALTMILKKMQRDGTVTRTVLSLGEVRYSLAKLGAELAEKAAPLLNWLDENEPRIERAREHHHAETEASRATELQTT